MDINDRTVIEARESFYTNGYIHLQDFISEEVLYLMQNSCNIIFNENSSISTSEWDQANIITPSNNKISNGLYGSVIGDSLLLYLNNTYSTILDKQLLPTYSYLRKYVKGNDLKPHTDRPSCQYSITMPLTQESAEWPFWVKDGNKTSYQISCNLGDAILYMGERVSHWREALENAEESYNIFLHYVDASDPERNQLIYDNRKYLGIPHKSSCT